MNPNNVAYTFSDVLIKPKYSEIRSRSKDVDLTSDFLDFELKLPVMSANMKTITGPKMAIEMYQHGAMGILHRFNTIDEAVQDFKDVHDYIVNFQKEKERDPVCGVSIGVQAEDEERFDRLYAAGARVFVLDVAHGHHVLVKNMMKWIRSKTWANVYLIAGNVATPEGVYDLADWGADAVKIGIGPSAVCRTRYSTGVGVPQLYAMEMCRQELEVQGLTNIKLICDGGITSPGSFDKAMRFADACMFGSYFAGTSETPGKVYRNKDGNFYKVYMGSASGENKASQKKPDDFIEGVTSEVSFKGSVKYLLRELKEGLESSCSYVGAKNLTEFKKNCEFIYLSDGARGESKI